MSAPLRLVLFGRGRMGGELIRLAPQHGSTVVHAFGRELIAAQALADADVTIDFTAADGLLDRFRLVAEAGLPVVVGTTGWEADRAAVERLVETDGLRLIAAPNFSLGVALFRRLVAEAARLVDGLPEYDLALSETHHRLKRDRPSGTALLLAETILAHSTRKTHVLPDPPPGEIDPAALTISVARVGSVPGTHGLTVDGPADTIELIHTARSRDGFAHGALRAARWIGAQPPGFYTMDHLLDHLTRP